MIRAIAVASVCYVSVAVILIALGMPLPIEGIVNIWALVGPVASAVVGLIVASKLTPVQSERLNWTSRGTLIRVFGISVAVWLVAILAQIAFTIFMGWWTGNPSRYFP